MEDFKSQIVNVGKGGPSVLSPLSFKGHMSEEQLEDAFCLDPILFGEELLLLGRQLADFAEDKRTLDVLAVDKDGEKVLIEFKVDPQFAFTDLQALAYAGAYANVENGFFPKTLYRSAVVKGKEDIRTAAGIEEDASLDVVTEAFLEFLGRDDLSEWDPSKQVRIKIIAPDFHPRVLHNIKWLSEVYGMPIEAVQIELFEINDDYHLKPDRIFPLPGAERFELSLRESETSKRKKNLGRKKGPVLSALVNGGILKHGDRVWLQISGFQNDLEPNIRAAIDQADTRLSGLIDEANPGKILWKASDEEEARLVAPSTLPAELAALLLGVNRDDVLNIGVGDNYVDEKSGKLLEDLRHDAGL